MYQIQQNDIDFSVYCMYLPEIVLGWKIKQTQNQLEHFQSQNLCGNPVQMNPVSLY